MISKGNTEKVNHTTDVGEPATTKKQMTVEWKKDSESSGRLGHRVISHPILIDGVVVLIGFDWF